MTALRECGHTVSESVPACPPASTRLLLAASRSFADLGVFPSAYVSISGKGLVSPHKFGEILFWIFCFGSVS